MFCSQKSDPFPGPAPIPEDRLQKFKRKDKTKTVSTTTTLLDTLLVNKWELTNISFFFWSQSRSQHYKLKDIITRSEETSEMAQKQAARLDLVLPEDAG